MVSGALPLGMNSQGANKRSAGSRPGPQNLATRANPRRNGRGRRANGSRRSQNAPQVVPAQAIRSAKQKAYAPVSQSSIMTIQAPSMSRVANMDDGSVRIRHREYIGDVAGSVLFASTAYAINPGVATSFPWLSTIALNYESYLFHGLAFEYETQKSTATSGTVLMAVDYDASDAAPVSKTQQMSYQNAVRAAVWSECCYRADVRDLHKFGSKRYLRSGNLAANQDIKTYDVGNLFISTQGCADATALGELYVVYDVELQTPQLDLTGAISAFSAKSVATANVTAVNIFGGLNDDVTTGGLPITTANSILTINRAGQFIVVQDVVGTVFSGVAPTITGTATVTLVSLIVDAAATAARLLILVNATAGQTVIFNYVPVCATLTASTTRIGAYQYSLA